MIEVRQAMAHDDFARHAADARERLVLERRHVVDAVGTHVQVHVDDRRREVFERGNIPG